MATDRHLSTLAGAPVTRMNIVWMAAALDDPNPIHVDEPFAVSCGLPTVIAHAPMSFGLLGLLMERAVAIENLHQIQIRFLKPVFPGDELVASAHVTGGSDEEGWQVALEVVNQDAEVVASGSCLVSKLPNAG